MSGDTPADTETSEEPTADGELGDALTASSTYKVLGEFAADSGAGVLGKNTASKGTPIGVEGAVPNTAAGYGLSTPDDVKVGGTLEATSGHRVTVEGSRGLRMDPESSGFAGNVIHGHSSNYVDSAADAATIGGGGFDDGEFQNPNRALDNYGTVAGGLDNQAGGNSSTVAGGSGNTADGDGSFVGGGYDNTAQGGSSTVGGGEANKILGKFGTIGGGGPVDIGDASPEKVNAVFSEYGTIGGGGDNQAGDSGVNTPYATVGGGRSNRATADHTTIAGGRSNRATGNRAAVAGGTSNAVTAANGFVGGGSTNEATGAESTVGGGILNKATADDAFIGGGTGNEVTDLRGVVGGGQGNTASKSYATVGGGAGNKARADYAIIGSGRENKVNGGADFATIGGGLGNKATSGSSNAVVGGGNVNVVTSSENATIGGGNVNKITSGSTYATISGGTSNAVTGTNGTVGGGELNEVRGEAATVAGGSDNLASGTFSTVSGGTGNAAASRNAVVPGGRNNSANGQYSFAAGRGAEALDDGTFVWSDSSSTTFSSTGADQFLVGADGGVGINTTSPVAALSVTGDVAYSGDFGRHVATVENTSGDNTGDILGLKTRVADPPESVNFISFVDPNGQVGQVDGNGGGGVNYKSATADLAEYFPKATPDRTFDGGDVVGLRNGEAVADPTRADLALVVSDAPMITGNAPLEESGDDQVCLALLGQVPVTVAATVASGDRLAATPDGRAVPVGGAPEERPVVGRALTGGEAGDAVEAFVAADPLRAAGADDPDGRLDAVEAETEALREQLARKDDRIADLEAENEQLRDRLTLIQDHLDIGAGGQPTPADD